MVPQMQKAKDIAIHTGFTEEIETEDEKIGLEESKLATKLKGLLSCKETLVKCRDQESVDIEQALGKKYFTSCHAQI